MVLAIEHLVRCARYNTGMLAGIWCWQSSGAISSGDWGVSADRWPEPPKLGKATEIVQNRLRSEIVVRIGSCLLIPIILGTLNVGAFTIGHYLDDPLFVGVGGAVAVRRVKRGPGCV